MKHALIPSSSDQHQLSKVQVSGDKTNWLIFWSNTGPNITTSLKPYNDVKKNLIVNHASYQNNSSKANNKGYYDLGRENFNPALNGSKESRSLVYFCYNLENDKGILCFRDLNENFELTSHYGIVMTIPEFFNADDFIYYESSVFINSAVEFNTTF